IGPLLAVGHRKTLDLADVPQQDERDSVNGAFPIFKSKLVYCSSSSSSSSVTFGVCIIVGIPLESGKVLSALATFRVKCRNYQEVLSLCGTTAYVPQSPWIQSGKIQDNILFDCYGPQMPFVLRGLTCIFPGGMKTGIVGRTGSGKSTLIQDLFRIVDPTNGQILIDGVDISTVELRELRSRLSIIPQDPTMFEGTIRSNLDPLEEYTDAKIWEALDSCQLREETRKKELKLNSEVNKNGEHWSIGQRQLVCLGRVILKKNKILVLDEATASVDTATNNLIQKALRQQISKLMVITIAHWITSVLGSDMVLVLDDGLIVEYDTPARLLEDKSSLFAKLVAEYTMRSSSGFDQLNN
ncbi:unnamed protein product, partial [Musa banksii]